MVWGVMCGASQWTVEWLWVLVVLGGLTAVLRLVAILTSDRLR